MRLIDVDKLLDLIDTENQRCITITGHDLTIGIVRSFIEHLPTAYDVDKVVEQIWDMRFDFQEVSSDKNKVLKIVKEGGVNE